MLKKSGFLLALLLIFGFARAQDQTENIFRPDNPNLINLNEPTEYTGSPAIYIQGVKAPEKATNDMEELQLKLFGTKNVREATKDTLTLSHTAPEAPENQIQNFTFQSPFHEEIQSGFIPHISNFMIIVQILNQTQISIEEHVTLVNTKENTHWTRTIQLPTNSSASIINYTQNTQTYTTEAVKQKETLSFKSPVPLRMGPNHLIFKYTLENAFQGDLFNLPLIGSDSIWPIEQFKMLILLSNNTTILDGKLLFGTNQMEIPDVYTRQMDNHSNLNITINRVVPPYAQIQLQLKLDPTSLPAKEQTFILPWILLTTLFLLVLYWTVFSWWEKHLLTKARLPKIKYPHNTLCLAHQMGTTLTQSKWQQLIDFGMQNGWPIDKLIFEQKQQQTKPMLTKWKTVFANFYALTYEVFWGTLFLLIVTMIALYVANDSFPVALYIALTLFSCFALGLLYVFVLHPNRRIYWHKKLTQLSDQNIIIGLTTNQVRQIYPLFILVQNQEEWRKNLIKTNPKVAQETHLYRR